MTRTRVLLLGAHAGIRFALAAMLAFVLSGPLLAQSPADRTALAGATGWLFDSTRTAIPTEIADPDLRGAVAALAAWHRSGKRGEVEAALFRLDNAASRHPDWPWPHYLQAGVHLLLNAQDAPALASAGQVVGETHSRAGLRHLAAALMAEPTMPEARTLLVRVTLAMGDRFLSPMMQQAVDRDRDLEGASPALWIVEARQQRNRRHYDSSLVMLDSAAALGADHSLVGLERARTAYALGDTAIAVQGYWMGTQRITPAGRSLYRQDLAVLITPDSLAAFDALPDSSVAAWLERFWQERDAAAANHPGERLIEHLRRWHLVHEKFRVPSPTRRAMYTRVDVGIEGFPPCIGNATPFYERLPVHIPPPLPGDPRFREPLLDQRALIYLKHGEPFGRTFVAQLSIGQSIDPMAWGLFPSLFGGNGQATDTMIVEGHGSGPGVVSSWVYWLEGQWRVFTFQGSRAMGRQGPTTMVSFLPMDRKAWEALGRILPEYAGIFGSCSTRGRAAIAQQRHDADLGIDSDSDMPPIGKPWNAPVRMAAIGSNRGTREGQVLLTFAIPGAALMPDSLADGMLAWPVRFRMVAFRGRDGASVALDTMRRFVSHGPIGEGYLSGFFEWSLPPGDWEVALRAWQHGDSIGVYALNREVRIPGGDTLALSDIVPGIAGGVPWPAGGGFPLQTLGAWRASDDVAIWYQVRGIPDGESYRTRITIEPLDEHGPRGLSIASTDRSTGTIMVATRKLQLGRLRPGAYRLTVTVTFDGHDVSRSREIQIVK